MVSVYELQVVNLLPSLPVWPAKSSYCLCFSSLSSNLHKNLVDKYLLETLESFVNIVSKRRVIYKQPRSTFNFYIMI